MADDMKEINTLMDENLKELLVEFKWLWIAVGIRRLGMMYASRVEDAVMTHELFTKTEELLSLARPRLENRQIMEAAFVLISVVQNSLDN
jgi:DNA uptake protein ComE-like DNA-binding protein